MRSITLALAAVAVLVPLGAGRAAAQPEPCGIRLVRAPDDVGRAVSARVTALGVCDQRLDVWIVRTPDGLYLVAQDALGRVRERVVPDVEVAAALIASWVELGGAVEPPPEAAPPVTVTPEPARSTPPPGVPPAYTERPPSSVAPTAIDLESPPVIVLPAEPPRSNRSFAVGAHVGVTWDGDTTSGAHIEMEALRNRAWFASVEGVLVQEVADSYYLVDDDQTMISYNEIGRTGVDGLVRMGVHVGGRTYLRPSGALGIGVSRHEILATEPSLPITGPMAQTFTDWSVGLRIGVELTAGLQVGRYAIEVNLAQVAGMQPSKPGVSGDDRMLSAGLALRFQR